MTPSRELEPTSNMTQWMLCRDFPKYVVSPDGKVKNHERDAIVLHQVNRQGIHMVKLTNEDGVRKTKSVALLVAQAYLAPPKNHLYNSMIHLDGDRSNLNARNLMWRPRWYAIRYHQMFNLDPIDISVMIEDTGEVFGTIRDLCVKYGLEQHLTYMDLLNGNKIFHYGYKIRRVNS